jgi:hypothetical protein
MIAPKAVPAANAEHGHRQLALAFFPTALHETAHRDGKWPRQCLAQVVDLPAFPSRLDLSQLASQRTVTEHVVDPARKIFATGMEAQRIGGDHGDRVPERAQTVCRRHEAAFRGAEQKAVMGRQVVVDILPQMANVGGLSRRQGKCQRAEIGRGAESEPDALALPQIGEHRGEVVFQASRTEARANELKLGGGGGPGEEDEIDLI